MRDVITFGSATEDIYTFSKKFLLVSGKVFQTREGICLNLGSKIKLDDVILYSGGGGTNTTVTFALQGLNVSYCGQIGQDCFGKLLLDEMKNWNIDTSLILRSKKKITNLSIFLIFPGQDRTVLVYRGASDDLAKKDIPWQKIKKTKWFYLAPFSGKFANLTKDLVDFAKSYRIKIAWNPGYDQLTFPQNFLKKILKKVNILILNLQEASILSGIAIEKEREILKKIRELTNGIIVITKGKEGAIVSDFQYIYKAPALKVKVVDSNGAGDAFGSGFVAGIIKKRDIIWATQFAIANSAFCVSKLGPKSGLLGEKQRWPKVKIIKEKI
jgi:sugar/nucleoside kinase (ribokinase family)